MISVMFFIYFILFLLCVLMSVAFFTLLERKFLSLTQTRIGPNKVLIKGILQPVLDGVKLFLKEGVIYKTFLFEPFLMAPIVAFVSMLLLWASLPLSCNLMNFNFSCLMLLSLVGILVYSTLLAGWASYSKYAMVGAMRSCSQSISYEISLAILFITVLILMKSLSLDNYISSPLLLLPVILMWWVSSVAENNRAPFDFSEGESELISGFNVEYGSGGFVLLFLAEYGMMLLFSAVSSILFFNSSIYPFLVFFSLILFIRSSYPRSRYDKLMKVMWFKFLPLSILYLIFILFIS